MHRIALVATLRSLVSPGVPGQGLHHLPPAHLRACTILQSRWENGQVPSHRAVYWAPALP